MSESTDVRGLLSAAALRLGGDAQARAEAEILLAHVLGRARSWLYARPEFRPAAADCARFEQCVEARAGGQPVAYLTGSRAFWSLQLAVSPAVLIPRPETELLVELALARLAPDAALDIADLGTGSGAIALALASERPAARVLATDASVDALVVARANAAHLGLANVSFAQGDWCAALDDRRFDLIVSNPPYIEAADAHLGRGDLRFEPRAALASGAEGLDAIRSIVAAAPRHLRPGAWLLIEHGWAQGPAVRDLLLVRGFLDVASVRDFAGHERVSLGRWAQ